MPVFNVAPVVNFLQTTLSGSITNAVTTITLTSTTNFQAPGYVVKLERQEAVADAQVRFSIKGTK